VEFLMATPKRILIVDDDDAILEFMTLALGDEGYEIAVAKNGALALEKIPTFQPDLIILDMVMPRMDGESFLLAFRADNQKTPVIGLSASKRFHDSLAHLPLNDFLPKPFSLDELIDFVKKYLPVAMTD
jgi:DNA-binding response OmpR family regulator